jgi:hypothetical protein
LDDLRQAYEDARDMCADWEAAGNDVGDAVTEAEEVYNIARDAFDKGKEAIETASGYIEDGTILDKLGEVWGLVQEAKDKGMEAKDKAESAWQKIQDAQEHCSGEEEQPAEEEIPDEQAPEVEPRTTQAVIIPPEGRTDDGAGAIVRQDSLFPSEYPASQNYNHRANNMSAEACLQELADMGVDFDWIERDPIPDAIVLPRPVFILGIRLKYNASCRPEENWEPPEAPSGEREEFDINAGPQRSGRRGRTMDVKAALALARFFSYLQELDVKQVDHAGIFPGRGDINRPSERNPHVWGKAIDLCWFYLSNGDRHEVAGFRGLPMSQVQAGNNCPDWGPLEENPTTHKERFLRQMDIQLRRHWTCVLSPDDTSRGVGRGNHTTHFHVDVHEYRGY